MAEKKAEKKKERVTPRRELLLLLEEKKVCRSVCVPCSSSRPQIILKASRMSCSSEFQEFYTDLFDKPEYLGDRRRELRKKFGLSRSDPRAHPSNDF